MNREWLLKKTQIEKKGVAWRRSIKNVFLIFFSVRIFFHGHWQLTGQHEKGRDHVLFHSATSTCSRTFRHLFATLHVRLLSQIFIQTTCIYQIATRWDLPPYGITIWLIDNVMLVFSLFTWWFGSSVTAIWDVKPLDSSSHRLSHHPCITQGNRLITCASQPEKFHKIHGKRSVLEFSFY